MKQKKDLPSSFYLAPHLLKKEVETTQGGITLQEGEIILLDPHKIIVKDQEIQTEPTTEEVEEIKKLSEELETQKQNYLDLKRQKEGEIADLKRQLTEKGQELKKWTTQFPNQQTPETIQEKINSLNIQLTTAKSTINQNNSTITSLTTQISSLTSQNTSLQASYNAAQTNYSTVNNQLALWTNTFPGLTVGQVKYEVDNPKIEYETRNCNEYTCPYYCQYLEDHDWRDYHE